MTSDDYAEEANQAMEETARSNAAAAAASAAKIPALQEDPVSQLRRLLAEQPGAQRYGVSPGSFGSLGGVHGYGND